jgi:hypothetical protein
MADTTLSPMEQDGMLQELGRILPSAVLDEWDELQFTFAEVVEISTMDFTVVRPDGATQRVTPPRRALQLMRDLRSGMYRSDKGAWYTARYVLQSTGRYRVDFDYGNEPEFDFSLACGSFATDLEQFPRDDGNIPAWLRAKLAMAATERSAST